MPGWDQLLVVLAGIGAAAYLLSRLRGTPGGCGGCAGRCAPPLPGDAAPSPLVQLEPGPQHAARPLLPRDGPPDPNGPTPSAGTH